MSCNYRKESLVFPIVGLDLFSMPATGTAMPGARPIILQGVGKEPCR